MAHRHGETNSPPFTLRQLECFVAVAETGSITAAAAVLHASDSAVSDALAAMERTLGASLLHRRRAHGATLTSDGLTVLPIARRMLVDAEELSATIGSSSSLLAGPVRIGATTTLAPLVIPRAIALAEERLPAVRVDEFTGEPPELFAMLDAGRLDLVVSFDIGVPPEYTRERLASTEACIVVCADHRLAQRSSAQLEEIADEPMILLESILSTVHTLELMSSRSITPRITRRTSSYELCRSMVGRGLGYTLLLRRSIPSKTWDGSEVRFISLDPPPRAVDVLLLRSAGATSTRVSALARLVAEVSRAAFETGQRNSPE